jgi:hypothetical protein
MDLDLQRARYLLERVRPSLAAGEYRTRAHTVPRLRNYTSTADEYDGVLPQLERFVATRQPDARVQALLARCFDPSYNPPQQQHQTPPATAAAVDDEDDDVTVVEEEPASASSLSPNIRRRTYDVEDFDYAKYKAHMDRLRWCAGKVVALPPLMKRRSAVEEETERRRLLQAELDSLDRARTELMPLDPNPYARFVQRRRIGPGEYAYSLPHNFLRDEA